MTPTRRDELINEWKHLNAQLKNVEPHSESEKQILTRQNEIAREIGEDLSKHLAPRT